MNIGGGLAESMETVQEINPTKACLVSFIKNSLSSFSQMNDLKSNDVTVKFYGYDERIKWNSYIVIINGYGVFGFIDGPFLEE